MRTRRMAGLLFAGGLAVGLAVGMTATAHASDPTRPSEAWNEIFLPFGNGKGSTVMRGCARRQHRGGRAAAVLPLPRVRV